MALSPLHNVLYQQIGRRQFVPCLNFWKWINSWFAIDFFFVRKERKIVRPVYVPNKKNDNKSSSNCNGIPNKKVTLLEDQQVVNRCKQLDDERSVWDVQNTKRRDKMHGRIGRNFGGGTIKAWVGYGTGPPTSSRLGKWRVCQCMSWWTHTLHGPRICR